MNINRLIKKIETFETISFDIFDTLIERVVDRPTDIFLLTGLEVFDEKEAKFFKKERINAEIRARANSLSGEVTLDDIYSLLDSYDLEIRDRLKNEEIAQELKHCYCKNDIFQVYTAAQKYQKKVMLISDMYLPQECIEAMLAKCGIKDYNQLYLSNKFKQNKITGKLFEIVIKENKINNTKMIHIGDSIKADLIGAYKAGIKGVLISRKNRVRRLIKKK